MLVAGACSAGDPYCDGVAVPFDNEVDLTGTPDPTAEGGFFVPAALEEAFLELDRMLPPAVTRSMYCGSEEEMSHYHMSLGAWMRNNWGLWAGGPLAEEFGGLGIRHPDDMSGILLDSYWRRLHDRPMDLEGQVRVYQDFWEAHTAPERFRCPGTGRLTEATRSIATEEPPLPWVVHHVVDCGDGEYWSYERSEGWRRAPGEVLERIGP